MTKFVHVLEEKRHNSTRHLMTNDAFSSSFGQRQRSELKKAGNPVTGHLASHTCPGGVFLGIIYLWKSKAFRLIFMYIVSISASVWVSCV